MTSNGPIASAQPSSIFRRAASVALIAATVFVLIDGLSGRHLAALAALALITGYLCLSWTLIRTNARIMLMSAVVGAVLYIVFFGDLKGLGLAASRALYLPSLLTVMTLLRVAAEGARSIAIVTDFLIDQPPSRRFLLLMAGGHVFGILLNLGGYQLLLGVSIAERDRSAPTPEIAEIQGRRISSAILIGFAATLLWSPVGVTLNLLLPLVPDIDWIGFLPYGVTLTVVFLFLGWAVDRMGPRPRRKHVPHPHPGAAGALISLLTLMISVVAISALFEALAGIPMRSAILFVVPALALVWTLLNAKGAPAQAMHRLSHGSFRALPESATEICLVTANGFLGLLVAEMIPPDAVMAIATKLSMGPALLAICVMLLIAALSMIGISPMITGAASLGAIISAGLPVPEIMILLAVLIGYNVAMLISPMTATVGMTAGAVQKSALTVGLRWQGPFILTYVGLTATAFLIWGSLL